MSTGMYAGSGSGADSGSGSAGSAGAARIPGRGALRRSGPRLRWLRWLRWLPPAGLLFWICTRVSAVETASGSSSTSGEPVHRARRADHPARQICNAARGAAQRALVKGVPHGKPKRPVVGRGPKVWHDRVKRRGEPPTIELSKSPGVICHGESRSARFWRVPVNPGSK